MARLRELQTGVLEGKLLSAVDVRQCWAAAMAALRDRALGMGERIASRGAMRPAAELKAIVDAEVRGVAPFPAMPTRSPPARHTGSPAAYPPVLLCTARGVGRPS